MKRSPMMFGLDEFYGLKVEEVMERKDLPILEKEATLDRVLSILAKKHHVWIVEDEHSKKIVGVITEHDVLDILAPKPFRYMLGAPDLRTLSRGIAEDIMSKNIIACSRKSTLREALERMKKHGVRRLPVVDGEILVGELRIHHIIEKYLSIVLWYSGAQG
ncbi:MAG: CBS domain-containing protein [Candidatus Bathyarchaeia archaeon]